MIYLFQIKEKLASELDIFAQEIEKDFIEAEYRKLKYHYSLLYEGEKQRCLARWIPYFMDILKSVINLKQYIESIQSHIEAFVVVYLIRIQARLNVLIEMINDLIPKTKENTRLVKINLIFSEINLYFFNLIQKYEKEEIQFDK